LTTATDRFPPGAVLADVEAFRFDVASMPMQYRRDVAATIEDPKARERYLYSFGPDFAFKRLLRVPGLRASYSEVPPGTKVPPHRHGGNHLRTSSKGRCATERARQAPAWVSSIPHGSTRGRPEPW